uniref:Activating transcription factor 5 n=1 Tax=Pan paniscus TaxID=9597 RepID=A0A2R9AQA5_PANPA
MSLLATLGLELDRALLPASGLGWLVDYGKLPPAPAPLAPYEVLGGALEGGLPVGGEPLAGDGFSDWMTERVDFTALLPLEPLPPGTLPQPSPTPPDLEAMASLLKKELEQMEDFFLDAPLLPPPSPPPLPPPPLPPAPSLPLSLPSFDLPQPPVLDTLDLLAIYCRNEAGQEEVGMPPLPPPQQPPPPSPPQPSRLAPYPHPATTRGDRKQKKRDQNKSAALRYRQRKRAEGEALEGECQGLEARNRELRERAESVEREIQYVKDLLIEVYKARSQRTRSC